MLAWFIWDSEAVYKKCGHDAPAMLFDILDYRKKITSFSQSCIKLTTFGSNSHIFLAYIKKKKLYFCSEIVFKAKSIYL